MGRLGAAWSVLRGREAKQSAVGDLQASATYSGQAYKSTPEHAFTKAGYVNNVIAFRCINSLSAGLATVPAMVTRDGKEIEHDVATLFQRPNPLYSWKQLASEVHAYYLINGNSYLEGTLGASAAGLGVIPSDQVPPAELYSQMPTRMEVLPDKSTGLPRGYLFTGPDSRRRQWEVDWMTMRSNILHRKTFNPLDDYYGQSAITAAIVSVDAHNLSGKWQAKQLQNEGRPSAMVTVDGVDGPANLEPEEARKLELAIHAKLNDPEMRGLPWIAAGLTWNPISLSPKDMDWLNGRTTTARDVCNAFNYPSMLLNIPGDNTYSNYQEARLAMYEDNLIPATEEFYEDLGSWLEPRYRVPFKLTPDWDQVSVLSPRRAERWARVNAATFLTENEKREEFNYPPIDGGDMLPNAGLDLFGTPPTKGALLEEIKALGYDDLAAHSIVRMALGQR